MTGRWFKWLSPDDVLEPQAIETLVNHAKKTWRQYNCLFKLGDN